MEQQNLPAPTGPAEVAQPRFAFADEVDESNGFSGPSPKRFLWAVVRYKWLVLALTALGAAAGTFFSKRASVGYDAQATLWVQQQPDRNAELQGPIQSAQLLADNAWVQLLRSYAVLDSVVMKERLYVRHLPEDGAALSGLALDTVMRPGDYELRIAGDGTGGELRTRQGIVLERVARGAPVGRQLGLIWQPSPEEYRPGRTIKFSILLPREAAARLNEQLNVQMPPRGSFMAVHYTSTSPERAARVVNTVADQFVAVAAELKRARLVELRNILDVQLQYARSNLEAVEFQLNDFLVQTITLPAEPATPVNPGTEETRNTVIGTYFDLKIERDQMERDRQGIQRAISDRTTPLSIDALSSIGAVRQSPELSQALAELTAKRAELRAMLRLYTPEYAGAIRAADNVRNLEEEVIPQLARNLISEMQTRMAVMDGMIDSRSGELREIPPRAIDEARYRRNRTIAENLYNELRERYENARLSTETSTPDVSILSRATPAQNPSVDRRLQLLLLCIAGAFGAGVGLAILLEFLDKRVRYPEQISGGMQLPILGAVPDFTRKRLGFGGAQQQAEMMEALRAIRLSLCHAHGSAGPMMMTITSPGSGDGKTFMVTNLAANFAELGLRVLMIDGDTRRGTLHRILQVERKPGLTDYLKKTASLDEVLRTTSLAHADLIPCGTHAASAPELLSSHRMGDLLAEIRSRYDVILVDSPPLGAGIDPLVLATTTSSVVLVLRTGKTDLALAEAKLAIIDRLPIRVLGAVMNGISTDVAFRYYSYLPGYETGAEDMETGKHLQPH